MQPWDRAPWRPRKWQQEALPIVIEAMKHGKRGLISAIMGSGKSVLISEICAMGIEKLRDRAIIVVAPRQNLIVQLSGTIGHRLGQENVGQYYAKKKQYKRKVIVCCGASLSNLWLELQADSRQVALMIVDEAHGSEAKMLRDIIPEINPLCLVGFTATPFRSAPKETISLFNTIIYRYTMQDALNDGVLVPMEYRRYEGVIAPQHIDAESLNMIRMYGNGPGIVSARNIADAEEYAQYLCDNGIQAAAIHSKIKDNIQATLLERLKNGELKALVHVALLAEGVDLPWLSWICLRRKVEARVRFLQEVGRVLRTNSGKTAGIVIDPHLLLGKHGLTSAEAIGSAMEEIADLESQEEKGQREMQQKEEQVVALDILLAYLGAFKRELQKSKILKPDEIQPGYWRLAIASEKQVEAIKKGSRLTRHIPEPYKDPIKALIKVPWALNRGEAADLCDVLYGGRNYCYGLAKATGKEMYRQQWSAELDLTIPDEESIKTIGKMKE